MSKPGKHVILDALVTHTEKFTVSDLNALFYKLAEALDMKILGKPLFEQVELDPEKLTGDAFQDEGGITGVCVISTSHFAIHTWTLRNFFSMDIFSCKPYEAEVALHLIDEMFGIVRGSVTVLDRFAPDNSKDFDSLRHGTCCISKCIGND